MSFRKPRIKPGARDGAAYLRAWALAVALGCSAGGVQAQDALLDRASDLLARRDAVAAYALLSPAESARAGDPAFDYLLGIAALDAGHVTRAIFALERAVDARPQDPLARAELGRAYLAAGDTERAREQLRQARSGDTPPQAQAAIDRVLGVVDQVVPRRAARVSGYLELGAGYDSNVNSASNQGEFAIPAFGGIVFQTTAESRRRHALVGNAAAGAIVEVPLSDDWRLIGAANLRRAVNRDAHDMDTLLLDATAGLRHTAGAHSQTLALQTGTAWVGSGRYRNASGFTAQWQTQFSEQLMASAFGQWSRQDFPTEGSRDNDRTVGGIGLARSFGAGATLAYGSVYVARERTEPAFAATMAAGCAWAWSDAWAAISCCWARRNSRIAATAARNPSSTPCGTTGRKTCPSACAAGSATPGNSPVSSATRARRPPSCSTTTCATPSRSPFTGTSHEPRFSTPP